MAIQHPEVPACSDCQAFMYDPKTWKICTRGGKPLPRTKNAPTPCYQCPKSDDGRPNPGAELRGRNARIYELYLMVRAGVPMPDDLAIHRNLALVQLVVDRAHMVNASVQPLAQALLSQKKR